MTIRELYKYFGNWYHTATVYVNDMHYSGNSYLSYDDIPEETKELPIYKFYVNQSITGELDITIVLKE